MRTVALAIALLMSGAAVAQSTTTQPDVDVDADVGVQPDGDLDVDADVDVGTKTTTHTSHGTTTHTTHGTMHTTAHGTMAGGRLVAPSNADPERDARGIAVISDPAIAPPGWNGTMGTGVGGPLIDAGTGQVKAGESLRPCTATVTDNCVQTYERGRR